MNAKRHLATLGGLIMSAGWGVTQPPWTLSLEPREGPYFLGERIHVRLCPATAVATDARADQIEFEVEPREGWRDPFHRYQETDIGSFIGQRMLRSYRWPQQVAGGCFRAPLTDWIRFARPGEYRIGLKGANAVKILVARPTPEWEARKLAELIKRVDTVPRGSSDREPSNELETLETEAAVRSIVQRMSDYVWPGLLMHQDFERLERILKEELSQPAVAVSFARFDVLARVAFQLSGKGDRMGRWQRSREEAARWVAQQIERKSGEAWRVTRATLQGNAPELAPPAPRPTRAELAHLPDSELEVALRERWGEVRDDSLIEVLRPRLRAPPPQADFLAWREWEQFTALALRRLMEINQAGTRALLIRDLKLPQPRFTDFSLRLLEGPIEELDERLNATWANSGPDAKLLARFGSPAIVSEVAAKYRELAEQLDCLTEQGALGYLMRVSAKEHGGPLVRQALARREQRGCYRLLLENPPGVPRSKRSRSSGSPTRIWICARPRSVSWDAKDPRGSKHCCGRPLNPGTPNGKTGPRRFPMKTSRTISRTLSLARSLARRIGWLARSILSESGSCVSAPTPNLGSVTRSGSLR